MESSYSGSQLLSRQKCCVIGVIHCWQEKAPTFARIISHICNTSIKNSRNKNGKGRHVFQFHFGYRERPPASIHSAFVEGAGKRLHVFHAIPPTQFSERNLTVVEIGSKAIPLGNGLSELLITAVDAIMWLKF